MVYNSPHYERDPLVAVQKEKDGKIFKIPAKALNIIWGRDNRYWKLSNDFCGNSSVYITYCMLREMPAELLQVSWLEVTGSVDGTNPHTDYEVGFKVTLKEDAFGWNKYPVYIMARRGREGESVWTKILLKGSGTNANHGSQTFEIFGKLRKSNSTDSRIYFGLYEVWSGKWKGGLLIHHAFVREAAT